MKKPSLALCLIVKGSDDEARVLARALENTAPYVDGIFITRTHLNGEEPNGAVRAVAKAYMAHLSEFEWTHDFAAARTFNFSQVPPEYDYILWMDADDVWRGLNRLRRTIKANPGTDAFAFWYLYDWDEFKKPVVVHKKTMVVRNDGCARWEGTLHEDLVPTRQLDVKLVDGIDRLHLTDSERAAANAKRNLEIAKIDASNNPSDPRSYWNLANSQLGVADYAGAVSTFKTFLESSESDDERYIAHTRIASALKSAGKTDEATQHLQMAIGLNPSFGDAYFQLSQLYYDSGNFDKAEYYCLMGMRKPPLVHRMIVFNPRDYDYNPMMLLAKIYYRKNRPDLMLPMLKGCLKIYPDDARLQGMVADGEKEYKDMERALKKAQTLMSIKDKAKLKKALDKLPVSIKSHPAIAAFRNQNFIKTESSGRDLVFYCGGTAHEWGPHGGLIGGSEEAVINLSRQLAKRGWNVTIYNNCGHKPITADEVTYRPFWEFNYRDKQDAVILWRWCKPLDAEINAPKVFVDLHDVISPGELTPKRLERVSKVFVKSQFHRSLFPDVPDEKIAVIPNGIDLSLLTSEKKIGKDPYLIINTSSPDRSMDVLPMLFRKVKERVPEAKMQWCYGWEGFKSAYATDAKKMDWMRKTQEEIRGAGIVDLGRLSQEQVGKLYQKASILAYPSEFAEIDCISVRKAQAAGCTPIATNFGALGESIQYGYKVHSPKTKETWNRPYQFHFGLEDEKAQEAWVETVVAELQSHSDPAPSGWAEQFSWPEIAKKWDALLH